MKYRKLRLLDVLGLLLGIAIGLPLSWYTPVSLHPFIQPDLIIGAAIALAGFALVMLSLILERRRAAKEEGNLLDD